MAMTILRLIVVAFMSVLFVSGAFLAGVAVQQAATPPPLALQPSGAPQVVPSVNFNNNGIAEFAVFWEAWAHIKSEFIGKVPTDQQMTYSAIRGVVSTLGDQHTHFVDPSRGAILETDLDGRFEGIGATVEMKDGQIVIVAPLKGRPAEKAGLQAGDIVVKIDGLSTDGLSLAEAVSRIRGPKGTQVTLTVVRVSSPTPVDITITRATIETDVVTKRELEGGIAYLELSEFSSPASRAVDTALREMLAQNPRGLILDLRRNPGGLLQTAIEITSQFVGSGVLLIEEGKSGTRRQHPALSGGRATKVPLVVLIDKGSASASEILAGAVQDSKRGVLVGEKTFGKGSVQVSHTLSDKSRLTVTVRHWLTPAGRDIHEVGIAPDFHVSPATDADRRAGRDPVIDRAVQYLLTGQ